MSRFILCLILNCSLLTINVAGENTRHEYIRTYYKVAISEMQNYGIPASITMAQGILESNNGNSYLAVEGRNHFGIKCHDWTGPSLRIDDDMKNECFRKYKSALNSYYDHSEFLTTRSRYASLFEYRKKDYKAWAKGLKKAGYATNPDYPKLLIKIIEDNELYLLDDYALDSKPDNDDLPWYITENKDIAKDQKNNSHSKPISADEVQVDNGTKNSSSQTRPFKYKSLSDDVMISDNDLPYILKKEGQSLEDIALAHDLHTWEVYRYNDVERGEKNKVVRGQRIYLDAKCFKASKQHPFHKVLPGETMYDISQQYGVRLKSLYRLNRMNKGTQAKAGSYISLYKREPRK